LQLRSTLLIAKLKRMQFGQSYERLSRAIEQLELRLEDLEVQEAADISTAVAAGVPEPEMRKPKRLPLP
jgi:transposase